MKDRENLFNNVNSMLIDNRNKVPKNILINKDRDRVRVDVIVDKINPLFINERSREIIREPIILDGDRTYKALDKGMWEESIEELNAVNEVLHEIKVNKFKAYELVRKGLDRKDVQSMFDDEYCFYLGEMDGYNLGIWISGNHCSASLTFLKVGAENSEYHSLGIVRDGKVLKGTFDGWDFNAGTELTKLNKECYRRSIEYGFLFPEY